MHIFSFGIVGEKHFGLFQTQEKWRRERNPLLAKQV